jgi:uncharacterized protein
MIVMLRCCTRWLRSSELVGTDLVQAVPLVASAAVGHLLFGDFQLELTASLLVGSELLPVNDWRRANAST